MAPNLLSGPLTPELGLDTDTEPQPDDHVRRDEVRRAVEQARADIDDVESSAEMPSAEDPPSSLMASMAGAEERASDDLPVKPPVVIIENSDGRVELVQVFQALNRVQHSTQPALLNHSSNSISVGLSSLSDPLDPDALAKAAEEVFGKECTAESRGNEISILVGKRKVA